MKNRMLIVLAALSAAQSFAGHTNGSEVRFARYPNSSHGKLAFSYHGDVWISNIDGSQPFRLTDHIALDTHPRFSPDGKLIAFNSNRMGNGDVWIISTSGGEPRQLTFHTTNDTVQSWTPDGKGVVIATTRGASGWGSPLYIAPLDGSIPTPMGMDVGRYGMISPDESMVAFNRNSVRYWRNHYKGNNQTDIWVQDVSSGDIRQLTDTNIREFRSHVQDAYPMWGADGKIYFLSERGGGFNIWSIRKDRTDLTQVTSHSEDGVQFPSISPDGKTITYESDFSLWTLRVPGGTPTRVSLDINSDIKRNMVEYVVATNQADGFDPSPDGSYVAVDYHGEIFIVPSEEGVGEITPVTSSSFRDRYQSWSPDGAYIAYVSDQSLEEEIWLFEVGTGKRRKISNHESAKRGVTWSKDSKKLAFVAANTIFVHDLAEERTSELAYNIAGGYSISEFSPDGKWLVFSRRDEDRDSEVFLFNIAELQEINLTRNPFRDRGGVLTPDGKNLVFTSNRNNGINHLFVLSLARITENPNDPLVKERRKREAKKSGKDEEGEADETAEVTIDQDGIDRRAVQITRGSDGVGSHFLSADGETVYYTGRNSEGPGLFSVSLDGSDSKRVAAGNFSRFVPTADRKMIFFREQGGVAQMTLPSRDRKQVAFTFTVKIDQRVEWEQMFEESWRVMKYRFYDENMHDYDWAAIKKKYKPLLEHVGENEDLYDLTNEMIGELNASHTGVRGPSRVPPVTTYRTRLLGFEMEPADGSYKVTHIYRDGPADKEWIDLKVGEYVRAIDGTAIRAGDNYWKLLNSKVNPFATVSVAASAMADAETRDIRIETVTSVRNIQYEEWVKNNREHVDKISGGRIAYAHIRSMNQASLTRFKNEIDQFWNKEGIVIDIRYNGGGNIDEPLLDILERRPYAFVNTRSGARTWGRRHRQTIAGPKVMLTNHRSFSDAEMTPAGFRVLGLGKLVGTPTGGGVIWTGSYGLLNGGSIRTPGSLAVTYDASKPNNYGINLENYGVPPDVFVENSPQDELDGNDRELTKAVETALEMLETEAQALRNRQRRR